MVAERKCCGTFEGSPHRLDCNTRSECQLLKGKNIAPRNHKEAKTLIGMKVCYLRETDIDKSGRGYFFPRHGTIANVSGRNIAIDYPENWVMVYSEIREMVTE